MAWSRDPRTPTRYMRGSKRYNDVGGHSPPGDDLENTRDHERIWFELKRSRSCCNCEDPGFAYCFETFDYPAYICGGEFPGGDTLFGYWPGERVVIGINDGVKGACGSGNLGNAELGNLIPHSNGSWRNGPYVEVYGNKFDMGSVGRNWLNFFGDDHTIEAWIKPAAVDISSGNRLIEHGLPGETFSQGGIDVYLRSDGSLGLSHIQIADGEMQLSNPGWMEADQWTHFVLVRNETTETVAIFINGKLCISRRLPVDGWAVGTFPSTPAIVLTRSSWSDIAYYNSALSPTVIRKHYQAVYGVEGVANPLGNTDGTDPTQVEDPTTIITQQISIDIIDGGGDSEIGSVPISQGEYTAWVTPENSPFELEERKGQPDGYAGLDSDGYVPTTQLGSASGQPFAFLREDQRWVPGRLPSLPEEKEDLLIAWYEEPDDYIAALPTYFSRKWKLDGTTFPFDDLGTGGQDFTSGTFSSVDEFAAFGGMSCPVFAGGTEGMQTAAVAASSSIFAFTFWVRVDALPASAVNLIRGGVISGTSFGVKLNPDGTLSSFVGGSTLATTPGAVTLGEWCHVWANNDSVGSEKQSRLALNGVVTVGVTSFGAGNGSGYQLAGDGFEGAISMAAACSQETDIVASATITALYTGYRSLDWSAYPQSQLDVGTGVQVRENDVDETVGLRSYLNFKDGFGTLASVTDDPGTDEAEIVIDLPDASGAAMGDTLQLDVSLQPVWDSPSGAPGAAGVEGSLNGVDQTAFSRGRLNFIEGAGIDLTVTDDPGGDAIDITVAATGGGGGGGGSWAYESRSTNTILGSGDANKVIDITATITQTLTAAATLGAGWEVILRNASTSGSIVVTLDPNGSETIDGVAQVRLYSGECRRIICDGSNFNSVLLSGGFAKFTADGTFYVPHGISEMIVECVGGGGGGGGGRAFGGGALEWAGSGGGGAARTRTLVSGTQAGVAGTGIAVDVGAGGAGGAGGVTGVASGVGANGTAGSPTTFGTLAAAYGGGAGGQNSSGGITHRPGAGGGGYGDAGVDAGSNNGTARAGGCARAAGEVGIGGTGGGSATSVAGKAAEYGGGGGGHAEGSGGAGGLGGTSMFGGGGGGAGGGLTTGDVAGAGGTGGAHGSYQTSGGGGGAGGAAGANGTTGAYGQGGGGGGGHLTAAGDGGTGGPAGGGGGGGGGSDAAGGDGGAGGDGECLVWYS